MACGETHPEHPDLSCIATSTHAEHVAFLGTGMDRVGIDWPNTEYRPPAPRPTSRGKAAAILTELGGRVPEREKTGAQLRDDAIRRVDENSPEEFREAARAGLRRVAAMREELTAEDVQDLIGIEAPDNRAWGPVMRWGVAQGIITKTSPEKFVQSRYPRRHLMDVRVWRSLTYRP